MKPKELLSRPIATPPEIAMEPQTEETIKYKNWCGEDHSYQRTTLNYLYTCIMAAEGILETTIYTAAKTPVCRTWQSKDRVLSQYLPTMKQSKAIIENIDLSADEEPYTQQRFSYSCNFACSEETAGVQQKFLDAYELKKLSGMEQISESQRLIRKNALKEKHDRIRQSIDDAMLGIRPEPKSFRYWTENTALKFSRYIFYQYKKGAKHMDGWCSHCRQAVKVQGAKHKQDGICPRCRSPITYIAHGRHINGFRDSVNVSYLQKTQEGCCIRQFEVTRYFPPDYTKTQTEYHEYTRDFFSFGKGYVTKNFEWGNFLNTNEYRWCRSNCEYRRNSFIFPGNLKKLLAHENWQYIPVADIARNIGPVDPERLIRECARNQGFEHLAKHGFWEVIKSKVDNHYTSDSINYGGRGIREVLGLNRDEIRLLKHFNPSASQIKHFQRIRKSIPLTYPLCDWLYKSGMLQYSATLIKAFEHMSWQRLDRYLHEQINNFPLKETYRSGYVKVPWEPCEVLGHYDDYLDMAAELGYNLKSDFLLFPKNLYEAHDQIEIDTEVKNDPEVNLQLIDIIAKYQHYNFATKEYLIQLPNNMREIIAEGHYIGHCVGKGGYASKMAKENCLIFFIRTTSEPDKPLTTLELNPATLKIEQCRGNGRGSGNASPPAEVMQFVEKWKKAKLLKKQKQETA